MSAALTLQVFPGRYAVSQLAPGSPLPGWWPSHGLRHASWTADEVSLVCGESHVPEGVRCQRGWRALKLHGPFDFALTGILKSVLDPLAEAGVGIFAISTYDTDCVLVQQHQFDDAIAALLAHGHRIQD